MRQYICSAYCLTYHKTQVIVAILLLLSIKQSCQTLVNSVQFHNIHRAPGLCQEPCLALGRWKERNYPCIPGAHRRQSISKSLQYHEGTIAAEIHKGCSEGRDRRRVSTGFWRR